MILTLIKYLLICFIIPELLGVLVCGVTKNWERPFFCYVSGFLTMVAGAYLMYLPIGFSGRSFHRYVQVCLLGFGIWILLGLILYHRAYLKQLRQYPGQLISFVKSHPGIAAFLMLLVFQIVRLVLYTQIHYSDDDTYIPLVGDIIHSDGFYGIDYITGRPLSPGSVLDPKFRYTGWFAFQAFLSKVIGVHPLIAVKTLLPIALILLHYMIIADLYKRLNRNDVEGIAYFMFFYGLLMEFGWSTLTTSLSYYFLTWVWYGKSFVQFIILPVVLAQFLYMEWKKPWNYLWVLIILVAGIGASTMALILLPAEGVVCFLAMWGIRIWKKVRAAHAR